MKYYDGLEIEANKIVEDKNNWQLDRINPFLKTAYYTGINDAKEFCTAIYLDGTGKCTIQRKY